jgi:hypothetical protein
MPEFKAHNNKHGTKRIARTATGYKGYVNIPGKGTAMGGQSSVMMALNRGVGDDGDPYIEIELFNLEGELRETCKALLLDTLSKKEMDAKEVASPHGNDNFALDIRYNKLSDVFEILSNIRIHEGESFIPQPFVEFVEEQQKVRGSLEQSLMHAFGNDCFLQKKGEVQPKNEVNRIQRLAEYFRNGAPEIKAQFGLAEGAQA